MTKASILLLYLRIFVQKPFRVICWLMLAIVVSYEVASTAAAVFQCTRKFYHCLKSLSLMWSPAIPRAWNKAIPGTCINITTNWYANAGFSSTYIVLQGLAYLQRSRASTTCLGILSSQTTNKSSACWQSISHRNWHIWQLPPTSSSS